MRKSTRLLIGVLALSLSGCVRPLVGPVIPASTTGGSVGSLYDTPLRVTVTPPRSLQALPTDWSHVRLVVESDKLHTPLEKTVETTGQHVTVEFRVPPGPITLSAQMVLSGVVVALGTSQVVISPGSSQNVEITMTTAKTTVKTLSGKKGPHFGEGSPATEAWLEKPAAIAADAAGNLYVADVTHHRICRISATYPHTITTVLGPDQLATGPNALALDGNGNLYFTRRNASTLSRVNLATKQITDLNQEMGGATAIVHHPDGYLLIADPTAQTIWTISDTGGSREAFIGSGTFEAPAGMALSSDGTTLYVADVDGNRVWNVNLTTKDALPFAGTGEWGTVSPQGTHVALETAIATPLGLALSSTGELYITSRDANQVYRVSTDGTLMLVTGNGEAGFDGDGGLAQFGMLARPLAIAFGAQDAVFIADSDNNRIRRISGQMIDTYAGRAGTLYFDGGNESLGVPFAKAAFNEVHRVAVDEDGNIYVADLGNARVRMLAKTNQTLFGVNLAAGHVHTVLGNGYFEPPYNGAKGYETSVGSPSGLALDGQGNLYVSDAVAGLITKVDKLTGVVSTVASRQDSPLSSPQGMAHANGKLYVADSGAHRVWEIDLVTLTVTAIAGTGDPGLILTPAPPLNSPLYHPYDVAVDGHDNLYIAEKDHHAIRMIARTSGSYFGLSMSGGTMYHIAGTGMTGSSIADGVSARESHLNNPQGIELDTFGNLIIASTDQNRLRLVEAHSGTITTLVGNLPGSEDGLGNYDGSFGDARLKGPRDVARGPAGELYVADAHNFSLRLLKQGGL